jgi:hypothetical protein
MIARVHVIYIYIYIYTMHTYTTRACMFLCVCVCLFVCLFVRLFVCGMHRRTLPPRHTHKEALECISTVNGSLHKHFYTEAEE